MDWDTLKSRRKLSLENFIEGANSESEALKIFEERSVANPPVQEIKDLFFKRSNEKFQKNEKQLAKNNKKTDSATQE